MAVSSNHSNSQFVLDLTGPWEDDQQTTVNYVQIGNMVTLHFSEVMALSTNGTTITNAINTVLPGRLRPIADTVAVIDIYEHLTGEIGAIKLFNTGGIEISVNGDVSEFPVGGNTGFKSFAISYISVPVEGWDFN